MVRNYYYVIRRAWKRHDDEEFAKLEKQRALRSNTLKRSQQVEFGTHHTKPSTDILL